MRLSFIAKAIGIEFSGEDVEILGIHTLDEASSSQMSFLDNAKYMTSLENTKAIAVLCNAEAALNVPSGCIALVDEEPYLKLALASKLFAPNVIETEGEDAIIGEACFIAATAYVGKGCVIGNNVKLLPGVFVGDKAKIGDNSILHANVSVYRDCEVGQDCIIHSGTTVGSDGFGFAHTKLGEHVKIYQNGNVLIEDDVEIGANCAIDRAVFGTTLIRKGCKIDNLIQLGHNVDIGEYSILVAQCGVAGSTTLGRNVVMGGQSAAAGHITIAPFSQFAARSGITNDVKDGSKVYGGFPLMEQRSWLKLQAKLARLLKPKK
ncbi:UDP-3-O-(3-hydroxymyristoyl)glucosamine N-acyltransferase [Sulfurimonas sp. MAG313]|nr:UDP-3-O-(3-hydroxymyristoyl)glucosamine N-acyltransferase [Sulfurimonas sp. MAG313]MDF1880669.1 UDP-3-O-(3-hydroxymyristoyl)glucosamine N-acyltransferase [Sulfurimonas sp. MAG313]